MNSNIHLPLCLCALLFSAVVGFENQKLKKRVDMLQSEAHFAHAQLNDTSMKLEMFLSMIEDEMHSSIRRIARPIAQEEVIKGLEVLSEKLGEIEVNGVKYNNVMAPPGIPPGSLTDNQIADVLTYIRNEWGNSASSVSPEEVANIRESVKDRAPMQMWTVAELNSK